MIEIVGQLSEQLKPITARDKLNNWPGILTDMADEEELLGHINRLQQIARPHIEARSPS